jgi:dGTP triphosphohydrolase
MAAKVNEQNVERDFELLKRFTQCAWQRDLAHVEALIDRIRVEMMIEPLTRRRKAYYRAVIDFLEDVVEERYEKERKNRHETRRSVLDYVKGMIEGRTDE